MITVRGVGYQFHNYFGIDINRTNGSGDFLLLYLRTPTEVMLNNQFQYVPAGNFILYKKGSPQIYRKTDGSFINDGFILKQNHMTISLKSSKYHLASQFHL